MNSTIYRSLRGWSFVALAFAAFSGMLISRPAQAVVLLNEIYVNPPGGDGNIEYIELISTTGGFELYADLVVLLIDSSGAASGGISDAYNLIGSLGAQGTGANGLGLLGNNYPNAPAGGPWSAVISPQTSTSDPTGVAPFSGMGNAELDNDGFTLLLVTGFTGAVGQDLDTNDDGVFEATPWATIQDSVGWRTGLGAGMGFGDRNYAPVDLSNEVFTPDVVARFRGDLRPNNAAAWYGGDILGDTATALTFDPAESFRVPAGGQVTPGRPNYAVPEPTSFVLAMMGIVGLGTRLRRRSTSMKRR